MPSPDIGWLAWIALVPLLIACDGLTPLQAGAVGFFTASEANLAIYHWLFEIRGFGIQHFMVLSTFFALFPAAWCVGVSWLSRRRDSLVLAAPALWVLIDYVRPHAGFMAFPWGTLAQSQHGNRPLLQLATLTGEYGITFLVALGNVALCDLFLHRSWQNAARVGGVIVLVHLVGTLALVEQSTGPPIRLAAVQPHILLSERDTAAGRAKVLDRLTRLTLAAAASKPALIVWPETAIAANVRANPFLAAALAALAQDVQTPIVFGAGEVEKFTSLNSQETIKRGAYNSAYVVTPSEGLGIPYMKRILMPFGEYVPLEQVIGWPAWLAPPTFQQVAGHQAMSYRLQNGTGFSPLICWENLFADLARESVRNGAQLLVLLTNDGWFGRTAEPIQHNLASVLRAVENRVPIVVASNSGPSMIVDGYGRIIAQASGLFREEFIAAGLPLGTAGTPYTRIGDIFVLLLAGGLPFAAFRNGTPQKHVGLSENGLQEMG